MRIAFSLLTLGAIAAIPLATTACGDSVPPPAQGALSYRMWKANGQGCFIAAHSINAPNTGSGQNVTGSHVGEVAVDGQNGAKISCKVRAEGDGFAVTADLDLGDASFSLDATVRPGDSEAQGSIHLQDNHTVATYGQPARLLEGQTGPCKIDVKTGKLYGIDSGWIWGKFSCGELVDERSPDALCSGEGTFLFENCDE